MYKFIMSMIIIQLKNVAKANPGIAIRFSYHHFLKQSSNLAIKRHFHAVTLTSEHLPLKV